MFLLLPTLIFVPSSALKNTGPKSTIVLAQVATNNAIVTYHGIAEPVAKALQGISITLKDPIKFKVGDRLKNEIILVDVTKVPLKELLDKIAKVEFAKWTYEGNLAFLNLDSQAVQAQDNATYNTWAQALLKKLDEPTARTQQNGEGPTTFQNFSLNSMGESTSYSRSLLKLIGPKLIVSLPKGDRIVFSTNPTAMQRPFPDGSNSIIDRLAKEAEKHPPTNAFLRSEMGVSDGQVIESDDNSDSKSKAPIAKVDLVISNPSSFNGFDGMNLFIGTTATLKDFSANGKELGEMQLAIPNYGQDNKLYDLVTQMAAADKKSGQERSSSVGTKGSNDADSPDPALSKPIQFTGIAKEFYEASSNLTKSERDVKDAGSLSQLMAFILDPVKYEPLTITGAQIAGTALAYKKNVIANIPDSLMDRIGAIGLSNNTLTPSSELSSLKSNGDIQVTDSNGWLTIIPSVPSISQIERVDRNFLKQAVNYVHGMDSIDVDSLAKIAMEFHGSLSSLAGTYLGIANTSLLLEMSSPKNWQLLQLYGLLSTADRQTLNNGGKLYYSSLTGEAAKVAQSLVYGANEQLYTDAKTKHLPENPMFQFGNVEGGVAQNPAQGYESEPTEVAPTGIPSMAPILGDITKDHVYRVQMASDSNRLVATMSKKMAFEPQMMGMILATATDSNVDSGGGPVPKITGIIQGQRATLMIKLYLTHTVFAGGTIHQDSFSTTPPTFTTDNLPSDVKKAVEAWNKMLKNAKDRASSNAGSGP